MRNFYRHIQINLLLLLAISLNAAPQQWVTYKGGPGPGSGKHIVLLSGDEEYRSEESMPMLAKILAKRFGFKTTVLFAVNKKTGEIDPNTLDNIPGLQALESADLMIVNLRFRNLPDEQMKYIDAYLQKAKPVIGIRPSVVAFKSKKGATYYEYSCRKTSKGGLKQGFGLNVLGSDWVGHHGRHGKETTLGLPVESSRQHPILRGVGKMWGPTDVYEVNSPISNDANILVMGQVLQSGKGSEYSTKKPMPLAWTKSYSSSGGKGLVFTSTMGDAQDFLDENFRRMMVNASMWLTGLTEEISAQSDVSVVGTYSPNRFGLGAFTKKVYPKDHKLDTVKSEIFELKENARICFVGNTLGERLQKFAYLETMLHQRFPKHNLFIRNLCRSGDEVKLRIRPDAKLYPTPAEFLDRYQADTIFGFFGFNESFNGPDGLHDFEAELNKWVLKNSSPLEELSGYTLVASTNYSTKYDIDKAKDGSLSTRWSSTVNDPSPWIQINFDKPQNINALKIVKYNENLKDISVDIKVDGVWQEVALGKLKGSQETFHFPPVISQSIRVKIQKETKERAVSFLELTPLKVADKAKRQVVLLSPIPFEKQDNSMLPDGDKVNENLKAYTEVIAKTAKKFNVPFIDLFNIDYSKLSKQKLTLNGIHLNEEGYKVLTPIIEKQLFGKAGNLEINEVLRQEVLEKNRIFFRDYRAANGVHWYGRRYKPYGPQNYPAEFKKLQKMAEVRDQRIWSVAQGHKVSVKIDDSQTGELPVIKTNLHIPGSESQDEFKYLNEKEALEKFTLPEGYKINLFASEEQFPELQNPLHSTFDSEGRLWVSCLPSYPHINPTETCNDKIIILEDTDNDGRADKKTVFADGLYLPLSFEFYDGGIIVSQQPDLIYLKDTDGDGKSDLRKDLMHGFDSHDTHVAVGTFIYGPGGGLNMYEGIFHNTAVETPYGPVRSQDGAVFRYEPKTLKLGILINTKWANPWGACYDEFGQHFIADASSGNNLFGTPISHKLSFELKHSWPKSLTAKKDRARPTAGCEIVSSRHFPKEVQGHYLVANTIGFQGIKMHSLQSKGSGWHSEDAIHLLSSTDRNFRPVDLEFAPDGSLYVTDWHNLLIGHMQHNTRDPLRDKKHGRIWRITYPKKPLLPIHSLAGKSTEELLDLLKEKEVRTHYRVRRELGQRSKEEVLRETAKWIEDQSSSDANYEKNLLQALWVQQWHYSVDEPLLKRLINAQDERVRTAALRVLRFNHNKVSKAAEYFKRAAKDPSLKVRLETAVSASWLKASEGKEIIELVDTTDADKDLKTGILFTRKAFGMATGQPKRAPKKLSLGEEVYEREAHCGTCHQKDGNGLGESYPPLAGSEWVTGDKERLIKIALHGIYGPITVKGKEYKGAMVPPMTGFKGILNNKELAAVLTYVRNAWGNKASKVTEAEVDKVRKDTAKQNGFYKPQDLLK